VHRHLIAGIAAGIAVWGGQASAAVTLDQSNVPEAGLITSGGGGDSLDGVGYAQTFTVGQAGDLAHVDIGLFRFGPTAGDVVFNLTDASNAVLFTQTISSSNVASFQPFTATWGDLYRVDMSSASIDVTTGEVLKWQVTAASSGAGDVEILQYVDGVDFTYAGGQAFDIFGTANIPARGDFAFRSYVDAGGASAAPEPAAWALMLLGFGGLGAALRARRGALLSA
jgi:hypothetical protein